MIPYPIMPPKALRNPEYFASQNLVSSSVNKPSYPDSLDAFQKDFEKKVNSSRNEVILLLNKLYY